MKIVDKIKKYINNKTVIAMAVFMCAMIAAVTAVRLKTFNPFYADIDLSSMSGDMLLDEDGSRYSTSPGSGYALCGPYMMLGKGYYTIDVDYYAENDFPMFAYSDKSYDFVVADYNILKRQGTHKSFDIQMKNDAEDFEIRTVYNSGSGEVRIKRITITENAAGIKTSAFIAFIAIIFAALCFLFREKIERNKLAIAAIVMIAFLSGVPRMAQGMAVGHDGDFHLLRIDGLVKGIGDGEFPVRMQTNWMEGYGYPVSIYYGDILLYISALLRIIGFSLQQSYTAYLFLINLGTSAAAYICFNRIAKNSRIALLGTAGYVFAAYRLMNIYVRFALGEYSAMMFFPLAFLAVYGLYTEDAKDFRQYMKNAMLLAIAMTGIIQTHVISTAIVSLIIAIISVLMIKKTLRFNILAAYASAAIMTIAINLFFLVPFLDYSKNVPVKVLDSNAENIYRSIQKEGAYISQYFMFYQKATGISSKNIGERMAVTPGIVLMTAFFAGIYFSVKYKDKMIRLMTFMSALTLWMASNIFPWDFIILRVPYAAWMKNIQFPWRFLTAAQIFLSVLLCLALVKIEEEKRECAEPVLIALLVMLIVTATQMFSGVIQGNTYESRYDAASIDSFSAFGSGEYARLGTDIEHFDGKVYANNTITGGYTRDGKYAIIECVTADTGDDAWVEFPIMNYKNYAAYGENGQAFTIVDGNNNVARVMLPKSYRGTVRVGYEIPRLYRVADICSLAAVAATIGVAFWLNQKQPQNMAKKNTKRTR